MKDPYKVLGLAQTSSLDEIKKAYRKLAKQYHPDLNPGNKEAEANFKDISHAFDLIGTEDAKAKWDRGETDQQKQQQYDDYVKGQKTRQGTGQSYYNTQQDYGRYASSFGGEDFDADDIFSQLFGGKAGGRSKRTADYAGEDELYKMEISFKEAAHGVEKAITLPNGKKLSVKIPAGIEEGKKLKFKGLGSPGHGKGPAGDVYVQIAISHLEGFSRDGKDILTEVPISFFEAIKGGEIPVNTIDGQVMLKVPAGVATGTRLRIKHKGAGAGEDRGNQIVTLKVVMPKNVDPGLLQAAQELEKKYGYNPRVNA